MSTPELVELKVPSKYMLDKGHIRLSVSPWEEPTLFLNNKYGTLWLCIGYRKINNMKIKNTYALPRIDDLFYRLKGAMVFPKIDLRSRYHHKFRFKDEYIHKNCFIMRDGNYESVVVPFGITNALTTFSCLMNNVLNK
jgi:hypothetical protein